MKRTAASLLALSALGLLLPLWAQEGAFDHPYYPLKAGHRWTYRSNVMGKDQGQVTIEAEREEVLSTGPASPEAKDGKEPKKAEKVTGFALKITGGTGRSMTEKVAVLKDGAYRFAAAGKTVTPPLCFFKLPLRPGDTWEVNSTTDGKVIKGTFVGGEENITLKLAGGKTAQLRAMTVKSKGLTVDTQPMELTYWFAESLGMVKQHVKVGDAPAVTLELQEFKAGGK